MKCTIPEISWHNREPVLSVDLHPVSAEFYRLASGGGDTHVLIWMLNLCENGAVKQEVISDLTRHQRAVNCVRWSSSGLYLASADDDGNILIWQLKTDNVPLLEGDSGDKETWLVHKVLRGHKEDVYDLCWSPDNLKLFSGSVDNTAILWDIEKGRIENILKDHKGFVQGVTWDPDNQILATISTDRICRLFDVTGKQVKARIYKGKLPLQPSHFLYDKEVKYFHDDTFRSFFRRLQFSPDGSLLIVPSGHAEADECKKVLNTSLMFVMDNLSEPIAVLPVLKQSSTVIRFCPVLFQLHDDGPDPVFKLPYRMIFAVGTDHDVILYDTQQLEPFARFQDVHYTRLTDLTWSKDGQLLIASSTDGFCSLITFEPNELGEVYAAEECEVEDSIMDVSMNEEVECELVEPNVQLEKEETKKKSSFIEKWAQNGPTLPKRPKEGTSDTSSKSARKNLSLLENFCKINKKTEENSSDDDCVIISSAENVPESIPVVVLEDCPTEKKTVNSSPELVPQVCPTENQKVKKRVPFITLSSPGKKKILQDKNKEHKDGVQATSTIDDKIKNSVVISVEEGCHKVENNVDETKNKEKSDPPKTTGSCETKENICGTENRELNVDKTAISNEAVDTNSQLPIQPVVKKRVALITLSPAKKTGSKVINSEITKNDAINVANKSNSMSIENKPKKRVPLITLSNTTSMNKSKEQLKTEDSSDEKPPPLETNVEKEKKRVPFITLSTTVEKKIVPEDDGVNELKKECLRTVLSVRLTKDDSIRPRATHNKRKPSFLERWATSTPTKRKAPEIRVKDDNGVIEILDD